jgi:arylsulfatase
LGGESGQWDPVITENNKTIGVPQGKDGKKYYFPDDMADKTIEWLHAVRAQDPAKPWFVYFSTGCAHAPHHVPEEWTARYKGKFDGGWDAYREQTFERQKQLGVIPADAKLTPRHPAFRLGFAPGRPESGCMRGKWRHTRVSWRERRLNAGPGG